MKKRTGSEYFDLMKEIITDLRNFESKYATKILTIHHYYTNDYQIEEFSYISMRNQIKCDIGLYMDDELTSFYPYVIKDHMFFLECSKSIPKYDEIILNNIIMSSKGLEITKTKLANSRFMENASYDIIRNEQIKHEDFEMRWELWTKAYLLFIN